MSKQGTLFVLIIGLVGALIGGVLVVIILKACLVCPPAEPEPAPPPGGSEPSNPQVLSLVPSDTPPVTCNQANEGAVYVWLDTGDTNPLYEALLCMCRKDEDSSPATWSWQHPTKIGGSCP